MDKKPTIFTLLSQIFFIFGITVMILNIFCMIFGESAKDFSTIFSLGGSGISCATLIQFLLMSAAVVLIRFLFMTDSIIRKMPLTARCISMFGGILAVCVAMITGFGWFPVTSISSWLMFIVSFAVSCAVSTILSNVSEKQENEKLAEALKKAKEEL